MRRCPTLLRREALVQALRTEKQFHSSWGFLAEYPFWIARRCRRAGATSMWKSSIAARVRARSLGVKDANLKQIEIHWRVRENGMSRMIGV